MYKRFFVVRNELNSEGGSEGGGGENVVTPSGDFDFGTALDTIHTEMKQREQESTGTPASGALSGTPAPAPSPVAAPAPVAPAPVAATPVPPPVEAPVAPAPTAPDPTAKAPSSWKPEVAAMWDGLAPEVKAEISRREQNFHDGLETQKSEASIGKAFAKVLDPYMAVMQQHGINPISQVDSLMKAHYTLAMGQPAEKVAFVKQILADYKIDPATLGFGAPEDNGYVDPQVSTLQTQISTLESQLRQLTSGITQSRQAEVTQKVNAFAADPKNDLFSEVQDDIAALITADPKLSLESAYEKAIWANPKTRATLLQRQADAAEAARIKASKEHAEKAAAATAANVKPAPKAGSVTAKPTSMDDTIAETMAKIKARAS